MHARDTLNDLLAHMEWADSSLWRAAAARVDEDSLLLAAFHHIHLVQYAFLTLWRGEPLEIPELSQFNDGACLVEWAQQGHQGIQEFVSRAKPSSLRAELAIPWTEELNEQFDGPVHPISIHQSILQVAMHSTHHRGQVALRLRELDIEPPMFDFIVWLWQGRPKVQWPLMRPNP